MKVLMKAKAVAILTAFLMVFAMMPLVAFEADGSEYYPDFYLSEVSGGENQIRISGLAEKPATVDGVRTLYVDLYKLGEPDTPFMTGSVKLNRDGFFDGVVSQVAAGTYNIKAYCFEEGPFLTWDDNVVVTGADVLYHLYIGGEQVTSANANDVFSDGKVKFVPASGNDPAVLILNNYTYEGLGYHPNSIHMGIDSGLPDLTIRIAGNNSITQVGSHAGHISSLGITAQKLTIEEDQNSAGGTLAVNAIGETRNSLDTCGIYVEESLTVTGGTITVSANTASNSSYGLSAKEGIMIFDGKVEASGYDAAIRGDVTNEMPGEGWKDISTAETDQPDTIDVSISPRELKYKDGNDEYQYYQKVRFIPIHKHKFKYLAGAGSDANKITAICEGNLDCPQGYKTNGITITLNEHASLTYDGTAKAATITGYPETAVAGLADKPDIVYYKSAGTGSTAASGEPLAGAPVIAGDYVAQIEWGGETARAAFSIAKPEQTPTPAKISGTPLTTMKAGDTSMTIAWQKVTGAEGYDIFFSRCDGKGKTTAKKAQTINGNSTFAWTRSGLTAGVSYKAYVKAYVMKNGSKQYVAASPLMHAYTKGYTKRYTNAKSVKVKKTKVSIKKSKTFKIKAKVKKLKKGKKLMPTKHELKLRYLSTDTSIATVSKKGKIKGVKAGTCYVYAYAHNGVFKKIKVTVK